jgi:hypothetical protein
MNIQIDEYTVIGENTEGIFGHHWFLACDEPTDQDRLKKLIDHYCKSLNDDYATERDHALTEVSVEVLPRKVFMDWMKKEGKLGGQHKFPRVLKNQTKESRLRHLDEIRLKVKLI